MFYFNRGRPRAATQPCARKTHRPLLGFLFAAALIGSTNAAHAVVCQSEKGSGYPWAWREIDGKRCWYKGNAGMDKKLLSWAASPDAPAASNSAPKDAPKSASKSAPKSTSKGASRSASKSAPKRSPSIITDYGEHEMLLQTYWPPLPPGSVFDDRFGAARANRI